MKFGFIYMIQRTKNNPRNGDTNWFPASKNFKTQKPSSKVLASVFWDKDVACRLPGKGCNHHSKVQTEAATGLQTSRQAFEMNLVSSRQCRSSQGGHYAPEIGRSSL
jgi:hypothetical protein